MGVGFRKLNRGGFMKSWSIISLMAAALLLTVSVGIQSHAQIDGDRILVDIPREVHVGEKVLAPGNYELHREASFVNPVVKIFNNDEMQHETAVLPIKTESDEVVEDTRVVLEKVGDNYYMTKIWIEGRKTGYEIPLPERARNLKRELEEPLEARSTSLETAAAKQDTAAQAANAGPGLKYLLEQEAERQELEARNARQSEEEAVQVARNDFQNDSESEVLARSQTNQSRIESQQRADTAIQESDTESALDSEQSDSQTAVARELPATSSNWLQAVLLGGTMIALGALLKWGR
jgi:hypothetical protein